MEMKEAYKTYVKGLYSVYYGGITAGETGGYYVHRSRSTQNLGTTTHDSEHDAQKVAGDWLETAHITEGQNMTITMYKNMANYRIFAAREAAYNKIDGVRVGDYIRRKDGTVSRATYLWDFPEMQPSVQDGGGSASFYLGDGYMSYSGGLNPSIDISTLRQTPELKDGVIWFFKNGFASCGNGIDYNMKFRVFQEV